MNCTVRHEKSIDLAQEWAHRDNSISEDYGAQRIQRLCKYKITGDHGAVQSLRDH